MVFLTRDGVAVAAHLGDGELAPPTVVAQRLHLNRLPAWFRILLPQQPGPDFIMSVPKDIGLDHDRVRDHPLDRETPAADLGLNIFNHYSASSFARLGHRSSCASVQQTWKLHCRQMHIWRQAFPQRANQSVEIRIVIA